MPLCYRSSTSWLIGPEAPEGVRSTRRRWLHHGWSWLLLVPILLIGCRSRLPTEALPQGPLVVEVVSERPHDRNAFTQGLVWHDGQLYESTGIYGRSSLRRVDPQTARVLQEVKLPGELFGEGLALVDERLIQLTWREQVARVYDRATLRLIEEHRYVGEGWGLCYDGQKLIRSDGSWMLTFHEAARFAVQGQLTVKRDDELVTSLNELECVGDQIYANVWQSNEIVRIDAATGQVTATIDASGLLSAEEASQADVLNGIAYDAQAGTFLITGKLWPKLFEVRFVPAPGRGASG